MVALPPEDCSRDPWLTTNGRVCHLVVVRLARQRYWSFLHQQAYLLLLQQVLMAKTSRMYNEISDATYKGLKSDNSSPQSLMEKESEVYPSDLIR